MQAQQQTFWQGVRTENAQAAKIAAPSGNCRFVDDFRPTTLCKHMKERGYCARADACLFAHSYEELHVISPDFPEGNAPDELANVNKQPDLKMKKKKDMCTRYVSGNKCLLGKVCGF